MTAVLVQQMVPQGVEMIVGAIQDPLFGPLIACGTGGVLVDVLADTAFRLHPLTASDAREMIDDLRGARLLRGYRGAPPATKPRCATCCCASRRWSMRRPRFRSSISIPSSSLTSGARVADARIRVESTQLARRGRRVEYLNGQSRGAVSLLEHGRLTAG